MKKIHRLSLTTAFIVSCAIGFAGPATALAATSPLLQTAAAFGVLSSTFTRNVGLTAITGNLGYTTLSGGGTNTVSGTTFTPAPSQSGIDQGTALSSLNTQACTWTAPGGPIDLSTDGPSGGTYAPGVYCTLGATSIGTGGIILSGVGTYIFRITGAFTTVDNSHVTAGPGISSCDVFWAPTAATTLGANTTFFGTDIDPSGITVGSTTTWDGRALAYGGTVTADTDIISAPTCASAVSSRSSRRGTITVVKTVVNDNGGTKLVSDFPLFVNGSAVISGATNTYNAGTFSVTETADPRYTGTFSGDCDALGHVTLNPRENKVCILTNNDIGAPAIPPVPPLIDVVKVANPLSLPGGPGPVAYTYTLRNVGTVPVTNITMTEDSCNPVTYIAGDTNGDSKLDLRETWTYRCSTTLAETHTNTIVATGFANGISTSDIATATVIVGLPVAPPLIHVTKIPSTFILLAGGGPVTYTETITNPGTVALANIHIADNKCSPVNYLSGDINGNAKLDPNEAWVYTCQTRLSATTTNTVIVTGEANGITARDLAVATVVVGVPGLPNTGIPPKNQNALYVALASILAGSILAYAIGKKRMTK